MATDDEAARKARSEKLRAQIDRLKKPDDSGTCVPEETPSESSAGKSPREFIHERMRELDKEESEQ